MEICGVEIGVLGGLRVGMGMGMVWKRWCLIRVASGVIRSMNWVLWYVLLCDRRFFFALKLMIYLYVSAALLLPSDVLSALELRLPFKLPSRCLFPSFCEALKAL